MSQIIRVGRVSDVPNGKMKEFSVSGRPIAVAHVDEEFFAFDGLCTHAHCSLAGGFLDGYTLTCYCHGGQFDISTGDVLAPPPPSGVKIYPVKVKGDELFIEMEG